MLKQKPLDVLKAAGKHPGLEIWVLREIPPPKRPISLFNTPPIPPKEYELFTVPPAKHGVFHQTDLYIVLKTKENNEKTVHFWIGRAYSEKPPSWLDQFEDLDLGWTAYQHFEFQGYECELFESYFHGIQPAIRYKRGKHPDPCAERVRGDTRFYKLQNLDKFYYRVREIPFSIALMTKEENFILDTEYNIRTYVSNKTTEEERNKCILVTTKIRELDHEGDGQVEIVDLTSFDEEGDKISNDKAAKLRQEIKNPPEIDFDKPDEDPASPKVQLYKMTLICGDDPDVGFPPRCRYQPTPKKVVKQKKSCFQRMKESIAHLVDVILGQVQPAVIEYEIPMVDDKFIRGDMKKPYKRADMDSQKLYMLQGTLGKSVLIWVGSKAKEESKVELTECLRKEMERCVPAVEEPENCKRYFDSFEIESLKNYSKKTPQWTHAIKIIEGHEPLKFKRYFKDWE